MKSFTSFIYPRFNISTQTHKPSSHIRSRHIPWNYYAGEHLENFSPQVNWRVALIHCANTSRKCIVTIFLS